MDAFDALLAWADLANCTHTTLWLVLVVFAFALGLLLGRRRRPLRGPGHRAFPRNGSPPVRTGFVAPPGRRRRHRVNEYGEIID
jgi:hypothetical protein